MNNKKIIIILIVAALAVTGVVGAVAYQNVFAATPTNTSANTEVLADPEWGKGPQGGYTAEGLAEALGISLDELKTAYQTARASALEQAVEDGLITQAQADALSENGRAFPFGDRWGMWLAKNGIDFETFLAEALGISVDELKEAFQTATFARIDEAVANGKLTEEQADLLKGQYALFNDSTFRTTMKDAFTDAVAAAVASGVITQAQADQILSKAGNMFQGGPAGLPGFGDRMGGPQPFNP